jgi:integration host factor subunit alpha
MTITKAHIVENLFAKNLFTKGESAQIIETLFELIKQSLQDGEDVLISGFGKFSVHAKHQRRGRNPQTGESMALPPRRVVTFHYSVGLKERVNGGGRT